MDIFLRHDLYEAAHKLGGAGATGKNRVMGSHPNILRGAQGRGPEVKQKVRNNMVQTIDLAIGSFPFQQAKNGSSGSLGIGCIVAVARYIMRNRSDELIPTWYGHRF